MKKGDVVRVKEGVTAYTITVPGWVGVVEDCLDQSNSYVEVKFFLDPDCPYVIDSYNLELLTPNQSETEDAEG